MKNLILTVLCIISANLHSQTEGQEFCSEFKDDSYFPLNINTKKIIWTDTFYFERKLETVTHNNKEYIEYEQEWKNGDIYKLYLREQDGVVYQYEECCDSETIRFKDTFEIGYSWQSADKKATYTIEDLNYDLQTPVCNYENIIVIKANLANAIFKFYYKKGYGYIGATNNGRLISFATPDWD